MRLVVAESFIAAGCSGALLYFTQRWSLSLSLLSCLAVKFLWWSLQICFTFRRKCMWWWHFWALVFEWPNVSTSIFAPDGFKTVEGRCATDAYRRYELQSFDELIFSKFGFLSLPACCTSRYYFCRIIPLEQSFKIETLFCRYHLWAVRLTWSSGHPVCRTKVCGVKPCSPLMN